MKKHGGAKALIILYTFFQVLELMFVGAVQQLFFPFELFAHCLGIFNTKVKRVFSHFYLRHQYVNIAYKMLILVLELVLLCAYVNTINIVLIVLISACLVFNIFLLIVCRKSKIFDLSAEFLEPASTLEIMENLNNTWQNYLLNQKLTKYGSIPYIGSLIGCIASFFTNPPLAVEGRLTFDIQYLYNILNAAFYFSFVLVYIFAYE